MYNMSIATLKKKSYTLYGKAHTNQQGQFSLQGVHRQLPMSLGRSVTRTPFRGPAPMGHGEGSRCRVSGWRARTFGSSYPLHVLSSNSYTVQSEVKKSTMNVNGYYEHAHTKILHGANAPIDKTNKDSSSYTRLQNLKCPLFQDDSIHTTGSCAPYTKTMETPTYDQYLMTKQADCLKLNKIKPNHTC
jgi:hypothetical protein